MGSLSEIDFFKKLYDKNIFVLGFPGANFSSTDYFPIIPWLFIFISGYLFVKYIRNKNLDISKGKDSILAKIGRQSMKIYLLHQIILYPLVSFIYNLTK